MSDGLNNYLLDSYETLDREEEQLLAQRRERRRTLVGGLTLATLLPAVLSAGAKKAGAEVLSPDTFNAAHGVDVIYCGKDPAPEGGQFGYLRDITGTTKSGCDEIFQTSDSSNVPVDFPYIWQAPNGKVLVLSTKGDYPNNTASIRISTPDLQQQLGEIPAGNLVNGIRHITDEGIIFTGAGTYVLDSTYTNGHFAGYNTFTDSMADQGQYIFKRFGVGGTTAVQLKAYEKAAFMHNDPTVSPYVQATKFINVDAGGNPNISSTGLAIDPKAKILYIGLNTGFMKLPIQDFIDANGNFTSLDWMDKAWIDQHSEYVDFGCQTRNLTTADDGTVFADSFTCEFTISVVYRDGNVYKVPYTGGPGALRDIKHLPGGRLLTMETLGSVKNPMRLIPTTDTAKQLYPGVPFELVYLQDAPLLSGTYNDCTGASTAEMVDAIIAEGDCLSPPNPCEGVSCDDGNACTDDTCVADGELPSCVNTNNDNNTCDDNDPLTIDDQCTDGVCQGTPPDPCEDIVCDDGNACTVDVCAVIDGEAACGTNNAENGTKCDDNDPLTTDDLCIDGTCMGIPATCDDADKAACDDENPCTDDSCNIFQGVPVCSNASVADEPVTPCDDGNPDTENDQCTSGLCEGTPIVQPEPEPEPGPEQDKDVVEYEEVNEVADEPDTANPLDTAEPPQEVAQPDQAADATEFPQEVIIDTTELPPDFFEVQTDFAGEFETAETETEIAGVDVHPDKHPLDVDPEEGTQPKPDANPDADTQGGDTTTNPDANPEPIDGSGSTCAINGPLNAQNSPDAMPMALTLGATLSALVLAGRQRFKNLFARN